MNEEIQCANFLQHEDKIKTLMRKINAHEKLTGKGPLAEELVDEVKVLLNCEDYNKKKPDCINCHTISAFRKRTAELVSDVDIVLGKQGENFE